MFARHHLVAYRELARAIRCLQETGPADEEVGNRLEQSLDELAQIERLALASRQRTAEAIRAARSTLRGLGIAVPAFSQPPPHSATAEPDPASGSITYSPTDAGACLACGQQVGSGPIGWATEPETGPVCDACLPKRCGYLALVMAAGNFLREMGELECQTEEGEQALEMTLSAFAELVDTNFLEGWPLEVGLGEKWLFELLTEIEKHNESSPSPATAFE